MGSKTGNAVAWAKMGRKGKVGYMRRKGLKRKGEYGKKGKKGKGI